ncbi:MAG: M50 family metallopeptidase [Saprospiraceae bacterium]|nr:M50 family metallopeptidase [Saprospiraceae bacterium]
MKFLLLVRVVTIGVIFILLRKFDPVLTEPLSTFATIVHELGHSTGAFLSGGSSLGYTLGEDSSRIFACTKGGSAWLSLLGGNLFSLGAAWFFVWLGRNGEDRLAPFLIVLGVLVFFTTRLFDDSEILPMPIVAIYLALFAFFILTESVWSGAFLIFFGFINLFFIYSDTMTNGVLSDVSRYTKLTAFYPVPEPAWRFTWFGIAGFVGYNLFMDVATTQVEWASGRSPFKNWDWDKVLLFLEILPSLIIYKGNQLLEFLVVQFSRIFDFRKR